MSKLTSSKTDLIQAKNSVQVTYSLFIFLVLKIQIEA